MNFFNLEAGEEVRYCVSLHWEDGTFDRHFFAYKVKAQKDFNKYKASARIKRVALYKEFGDGAILAEWDKEK